MRHAVTRGRAAIVCEPKGAIVSTSAPPPSANDRVAASAVHATKWYGHGDTAVAALKDVSVSFDSGRFAAVMGASGSGKSTLMHCLAGLDRLTDGRIIIGGTDLSTLDDRALTLLRRDRIGFVFQAFNLVPTLTAKENIELPVALAGSKVDPAWFDEVVTMVDLRDRLAHRPSELSGGQQQRVAIARALASKPELIFADEPTGNLDSASGTTVLEFLRHAVDHMGQTIVMVTHDPAAASWADRAVFLSDGGIVGDIADPTAASVLERMQALDPRMAAGHERTRG
ncbi:MAG: ABC transporter ATP-binding protein [Actinobacteria bacterium]|nr:ABC transporter ATP-binding protein [Actinomycetota bacterium]